MSQGTLKIHTENILPIIKKWLYSDKDIFIRELIANACDALRKLQILRDQGILEVQDEELKIELFLNAEEKTIRFSDTGIGMTAEEVEKYIAQVAFSGAEEFMSKYKTPQEKDQIIGHFGLGFYSAYMVADKVVLDSLSYQTAAEAACWTCDGSSSYTLEKGERTARGTTITLFVNPDEVEYLEEEKVRSILQKYCAFLPFPIFLNGSPINEKEPLWIKNSNQCSEKEYLDFYHTLHPMDPDPLFWIHLNIDFPFHVQGILYFPKITKSFEWQKSPLKLFCNRVFVSDQCKDLLPDYLTCLRGALDSPDIPLNVSRSSLQTDRVVKQLASHISKKIADRLTYLYQNEREKFIEAWPSIELIVKLGMLQDDKFYEKAKDFLVWKTIKNEWISQEEAKARSGDKIFYTLDEHSPLLQLYATKEVLLSSSPIDSSLLHLLESKYKIKFQRVDGALDTTLLDGEREKTVLDASGKTEAGRLEDFCRPILEEKKVEIEAKSLTTDALPAFLILEEQNRRMRDYFALTQGDAAAAFLPKKTFVLNTNNKLVSSILKLQEEKPTLAKDIVLYLYELALLSQKEMEPAALSSFVTRSHHVLEGLTEKNLSL